LYQTRGSDFYDIGFRFRPEWTNDHAQAYVAKNGLVYLGWYCDFYVRDFNNCAGFHYYRAIAGYKQVNGVWRSWACFFIGKGNGDWSKI